MNRQEFIDQLREYLKVLQDEEQEDILAEYSQHIEMKMKNGLSEEEAIRDFGQVKELAAEILEAYHVSEALQRKSFLGAAASWLGEKAAFVGRGIRKACCFIWKQICRPFALISRKGSELAERLREKRAFRQTMLEGGAVGFAGAADRLGEASGVGQDGQLRIEGGVRMGKRSIFERTQDGLKRLFGFCFRLFVACCRLAWNGAVICGAGFFGLMGLFFLFCFGTLVVLWIQGYPLAGLVCGCLGAVLCCAALTLFGGTFFWRKKRGDR